MRSGDPGPDRPWRMPRVGPDLLFASQEACQQRSPAVQGRPQDAVGCYATPATKRMGLIIIYSPPPISVRTSLCSCVHRPGGNCRPAGGYHRNIQPVRLLPERPVSAPPTCRCSGDQRMRRIAPKLPLIAQDKPGLSRTDLIQNGQALRCPGSNRSCISIPVVDDGLI